MKFTYTKIVIMACVMFFFAQASFAQTNVIHFSHNAAVPEKTDMDELAKTVEENKTAFWSLEGRASSSGSTEHNEVLSQKRIRAVFEKLIALGVSQKNISTKAVGETYANQTIDDAEDRVVIISYKTIIAETPVVQEEKKYTTAITVWDGLEQKPISGTYALGNQTFSFTDGFQLSTTNTNPVKIKISAQGYRDSTIVVNPSTASYRAELLPDKVLEKLVFENIYFYPGSPEILPESYRALEQLYIQLKDKKDANIEIRGHINWPLYHERTPDEASQNQKLSELRALTVMNYLIKKGIPREILTYKGMSNTQMVYPQAATEGQMAYNRRVEIIVLKK